MCTKEKLHEVRCGFVEEEYNLDSGRGRVIPFKGHRINQEQSFTSGSTAYLGNRDFLDPMKDLDWIPKEQLEKCWKLVGTHWGLLDKVMTHKNVYS